jgi:hypothetical protein
MEPQSSRILKQAAGPKGPARDVFSWDFGYRQTHEGDYLTPEIRVSVKLRPDQPGCDGQVRMRKWEDTEELERHVIESQSAAHLETVSWTRSRADSSDLGVKKRITYRVEDGPLLGIQKSDL